MASIQREQPKLTDWTELAGEISGVPNEIALAIASGRAELARLLKRPLNAEESRAMGHAFGVMIETVIALQQHSSQVAERATQMRGHVLGCLRGLDRLRLFANFKDETLEDDEEF